MELSNRTFLVLLLTILPIVGAGQELKSNLFIRTPQIVNYNFNLIEISYSPVISIGAGLSHKSKFIELGKNWNLDTNWFGEITYVLQQSLESNSFIYTSGLCFFLYYSFDWGSIGLPLCIGVAYSQHTISLNTRTILNLSLNLN